MKDEIFIFLGKPYNGKAYRKLKNSPIKQYCNSSEIIEFITDSINSKNLNKGIKYLCDGTYRFKYKFNKGYNKESVSVVIDLKDKDMYLDDLLKLSNLLNFDGTVNNMNIKKIQELLEYPIILMTYTDILQIMK